MNGTLAAEALAICTGIFPKHPPTPASVAAASRLHAKVEAATRRFLAGKKPEKWEAWQRPPGQEDLHVDLVAPLDVEGWQVDHIADPIIYPQWIMVVNAAKKQLADAWPIFDAAGTLTPENHALAEDEYGNVWDLVRAVDGITNFLADLESYVLTREQVEIFKACFPEFYDTCFGEGGQDDNGQPEMPIIFQELTTLVKQKKELTWQQEDMIRILRGLPDEAPITIPQPKMPAKPPTGPQQEKKIQQTRPTAERIDAEEAR